VAWLIGEFIFIFSQLGVGQYYVQRYVSCATVEDAKTSVWIGSLIAIILGSICIPLIGMASISYFSGCDPVMSKKIPRYDALIPYLVAKVFKNSPGMVGLFISAAYR
jgi:Na+/proline symporter